MFDVAFKAFNALYRMGSEVECTSDCDGVKAVAAAGECGNGILLANQGIEPVAVSLSATGAATDLTVRLTDPIRTYEVVRVISQKELSKPVSLILPAQAFAYVGTDLKDPAETFDKDCYRSVSATPPKENVDVFFD